MKRLGLILSNLRDYEFDIRIAAMLGIVFSLYRFLVGDYLVAELGYVSIFTVGSVSAIILSADVSFRKQGVSKGKAIILATLYANAFVWSFELLYHFTFPVNLNYFRLPFLDGEGIRYLVMNSIPLFPLGLVIHRLKIRLISVALFCIFCAFWTVWVLSGFPQYFLTGTFYPVIFNLPGYVVFSFSMTTKVCLGLFFLSLAWPHGLR